MSVPDENEEDMTSVISRKTRRPDRHSLHHHYQAVEQNLTETKDNDVFEGTGARPKWKPIIPPKPKKTKLKSVSSILPVVNESTTDEDLPLPLPCEVINIPSQSQYENVAVQVHQGNTSLQDQELEKLDSFQEIKPVKLDAVVEIEHFEAVERKQSFLQKGFAKKNLPIARFLNKHQS